MAELGRSSTAHLYWGSCPSPHYVACYALDPPRRPGPSSLPLYREPPLSPSAALNVHSPHRPTALSHQHCVAHLYQTPLPPLASCTQLRNAFLLTLQIAQMLNAAWCRPSTHPRSPSNAATPLLPLPTHRQNGLHNTPQLPQPILSCRHLSPPAHSRPSPLPTVHSAKLVSSPPLMPSGLTLGIRHSAHDAPTVFSHRTKAIAHRPPYSTVAFVRLPFRPSPLPWGLTLAMALCAPVVGARFSTLSRLPRFLEHPLLRLLWPSHTLTHRINFDAPSLTR